MRRYKMKQLYIKQKVFSLSGKFTVKDQKEKDVYYVEGSFMKIPKTFSIKDENKNEIALITKKVLSFLPKFFVEINGQEVLTIKKEFSFFKARYNIEAAGMEVLGNWWDMDFQVLQNGKVIGKVNKEWFTWGDSYKVQILNEELETIVIALVIAIDCVKADEAAAASSSTH
ncbi:LURP-one-related family protein [Niallia alba]|nr:MULTISPECIES: LURP-one-related family protein [Niallia]MCB5239335.1 LURP-one-related family protein [Niallia circulans]MDU1845642.1 LURP-one-related family protein [Niallia nealsonii]MED3791090.1 LURP-one-related family protein [Niallia alba]